MTAPELGTRPPAETWRRVGRAAAAAVVMLAAMVAAERAMGRLVISKSGQVRWWVNDRDGPETSQQLFDWYSVSHVEHGLLFYGVAWLAGRKWRRLRTGAGSFLAVMAIEVAWELFENSPFTIHRFRAQTAAVGYAGDTILNSCMDVVSCQAGWALARVLPAWGAVALFVGIEVLLAAVMRDSFVLSGVMLVWPAEALKRWQQGG